MSQSSPTSDPAATDRPGEEPPLTSEEAAFAPAGLAAVPRVAGLALSPDGRRLAIGVQSLDPEKKKWRTALWEVDPAGQRPARRLTRSAPGEASPAWAPDGSLLFTSARPDPEATGDGGKDPKPALWALPAGGGEARLAVHRPPGISSFVVATDSGDVVVASPTMHGAADAEADELRRTQRKDAGVTALLHEAYPVRYWDSDLGPDAPHLYWAGPLTGTEAADHPVRVRDLTPEAVPPRGADDDMALSPDGRLLVRSEHVPDGLAGSRTRLVVTETSTGDTRVLVDDRLADVHSGAFSHDGERVVCVREHRPTYAEPPDYTLLLVELADGAIRDLTSGFDRWPSAPQFGADGSAVYFLADDDGRHALFRVGLDSGAPVRLTADGAYSDLQVARDGSALYALRSAYDSPPQPVRLDPEAVGQDPRPLLNPGALGPLPGTLHEVQATADDGARVQSWLVLPEGASADSPAPLVLWIHGGPLMSWNSWSWRWCPWVLAARGYAVLLPNPALSQGFGQDFVRRGWGEWGGAPYTDLMAAVDEVELRPDVDASRTAAMGGSFGGYLANWIATRTDRFQAIVTHASLYAIDSFTGTTDDASYWEREWGDPLREPKRYEQNSPHRFADAIRTPMLVIHGDRDYRVPIGEALRLWYDLQKRGIPSKFLYFPDENHWVLTPGNATVWYETVLAFLDQYVLGADWRRPDLV